MERDMRDEPLSSIAIFMIPMEPRIPCASRRESSFLIQDPLEKT